LYVVNNELSLFTTHKQQAHNKFNIIVPKTQQFFSPFSTRLRHRTSISLLRDKTLSEYSLSIRSSI